LYIGTEIKGCPKLATGITPQIFFKKTKPSSVVFFKKIFQFILIVKEKN